MPENKNRLYSCTLTRSKSRTELLRAHDYHEAAEIMIQQWLPTLSEKGSDEITTHVEPFIEDLEETSYQFLTQEVAEVLSDVIYKIVANDNGARGQELAAIALVGRLAAMFIASEKPALYLLRNAQVVLEDVVNQISQRYEEEEGNGADLS